jgi:hypothetical protein
MESEIRWVYDRIRLHLLMQEYPQWSAESYAEVLGRSEKWARKWQSRISACDVLTLATFCSASRAPKSRPRQTSPEVKHIIGNLQQQLSEQYHRTAGVGVPTGYV